MGIISKHLLNKYQEETVSPDYDDLLKKYNKLKLRFKRLLKQNQDLAKFLTDRK